jgi:hypothetical protein
MPSSDRPSAKHRQPNVLFRIDLKQAFDVLPRERLHQALLTLGVSPCLRRWVLQSLQATQLWLPHEHYDAACTFRATSGVSQGRPDASALFSIVLGTALSAAWDQAQKECWGFPVGAAESQYLPWLSSVDDLVLLAVNMQQMRRIAQLVFQALATRQFIISHE